MHAAHIHIHTHTYTYTHTHTHTHTYTHTYTYTHIYTHTHAYTHTHTPAVLARAAQLLRSEAAGFRQLRVQGLCVIAQHLQLRESVTLMHREIYGGSLFVAATHRAAAAAAAAEVHALGFA